VPGDGGAHGFEPDLVGWDDALLRCLHPQPVIRHAGRSVDARRDRVRPDSVFVDVDHFRLADGTSRARGHERCDDIARALRCGGKHARVHLDACRYAEDRQPLADDVVDVARGAVAAREEDQVDAAAYEFRRCSAGVVGGGGAAAVAARRQHLRVE
jgi:hypothetical protein